MKYIVILGDGMADEPLQALDNRTPLAYANTPCMDALAGMGQMGLAKTVPDGMKPGSDEANLAVMGYNPAECYSGRSPLEALSVGAPMEEGDVIFRCNLVTVSEDAPSYGEKTIVDHSAGEISSQEAAILMDAIREAFDREDLHFYNGTSYRHITVWKGGQVLDMAQPHDHLGEKIAQYLPEEPLFHQMMEKSFDILNDHPINRERAKQGLNKANSLWFWGAGTKPSLKNFREKTGLEGAVISAVDLLKGIALGAGMTAVDVPGANGSLHTNYEGKAQAAVDALLKQGKDYVYVHVEAPDEMSHQGSVQKKIAAIEALDSRVIQPIFQQMEASNAPYRMLIMPDHPTPICIRTHTSNPVPYILFDSRCRQKRVDCYSEETAAATGIYQSEGWRLLDALIEKE